MKSDHLNTLRRNLEVNFKVDYCKKAEFGFHGLSNEFKLLDVELQLQKKNNDHDDVKENDVTESKAGLLFGEGRFISFAPKLTEQGIFILILADINPLLHMLTVLMEETVLSMEMPMQLNKTMSITENLVESFLLTLDIIYAKHNISIPNKYKNPFELNKARSILDTAYTKIVNQIEHDVNQVGKKHFLFDIENFTACKKALKEMCIIRVNLNLMNEDDCAKFAEIVHKKNVALSICNFSNIRAYDNDDSISSTVPVLLQFSKPLIIYSVKSKSGLINETTTDLNYYLNATRLSGNNNSIEIKKRDITSSNDINNENIQDEMITNNIKVDIKMPKIENTIHSNAHNKRQKIKKHASSLSENNNTNYCDKATKHFDFLSKNQNKEGNSEVESSNSANNDESHETVDLLRRKKK